MRSFIPLLLVAALVAGCSSSSPTKSQLIDNGNPGQIRVTMFFDENQNGKMDTGETGLVDGVSISQDISCPPSDLQNLNQANTNANGEVVFKDLKPGAYCVAYMGSRGLDTKMTIMVTVSSDQVVDVLYGLTEK
jgi:uncharacterized protein (DUF2141 family)